MGYSLDGNANVTSVANETFTDLADGSHFVIVYANDTLGLVGASNMIHFTIDTVSPNITDIHQIPSKDGVTPEDTVKVNATVEDHTSEIASVLLNYTINNNGTWFSKEMSNLAGSLYNATIPSLEYCNDVNYTIIAEDAAGNTVTSQELGYSLRYHVIPEFSSSVIVLSLMTTISLAIMIFKRRYGI